MRMLVTCLKIGAVVLVIALIIGAQIDTHVSVPPGAIVYADDGARAIVAPQCRQVWRRFSARKSAVLRETVFSDVQARGYVPNKNCQELGAFNQQGPTLTGLLFAKIGLIPKRQYWWDRQQTGAAGAGFPAGKHWLTKKRQKRLMQAEAASVLGVDRGADRVVAALKNAAAATGSDFHYLLGTAMRESSLKPNAQSSSSSATGLFQFIDQTWLGLVKEHGAQHGLGDFAAAITKQADGRYRADADTKQTILALRKDPQVCALMAGEYARTTQGALRASLGREVCGGELYAAHFLGPDAALKLIKLAGSDPDASAAAQFPQAASANKSVFFHTDGTSKSVREVYDWAVRQPGSAGTVRMAQASAEPSLTLEGARTQVASAHDAQLQMLLASVMNWQPKHSPFSALFGTNDATPSSAMSFSPGLLGLLSDAKDSTS